MRRPATGVKWRSSGCDSGNEALADAPELLNSDPYSQGWLIKVTPTAPDEGGCITAEDYAQAVAS